MNQIVDKRKRQMITIGELCIGQCFVFPPPDKEDSSSQLLVFMRVPHVSVWTGERDYCSYLSLDSAIRHSCHQNREITLVDVEIHIVD